MPSEFRVTMPPFAVCATKLGIKTVLIMVGVTLMVAGPLPWLSLANALIVTLLPIVTVAESGLATGCISCGMVTVTVLELIFPAVSVTQ